MANVVIVGMQWGDEGKGKIVDLICPAFDAVARYQGGHNAGHTVRFGDQHFSLHVIPSGIVHPSMHCVLGNGMVLSPEAFFKELSRLAEAGIDPGDRLSVSDRIQILLPLHALIDQARELARGEAAIGTTSRGIGPAYESKVSRYGLRGHDLISSDLEAKLEILCQRYAGEFAAASVEIDRQGLLEECRDWGNRLSPYMADTATLLNRWVAEGKSLLFEGAQGTLLDTDHGTYPYVTSSNTTAGAASTGTGVAPTSLDGVLGILKAYTSRVGAGPFVTELEDEMGERLRELGHEYGTTTGRPRRCGWLDTVAASYAQRLNGVSGIALTKLDILDDLDEIPVCVAYRIDGQITDAVPADLARMAQAEPIYETLPGWKSPTTGTLDFDDLPKAAKAYVRFVEEKVGAPVVLVSSGPQREETILRTDHPAWTALVGDRSSAILTARDG